MKNLFNDISQEEKSRILEMHSGKKNIIKEDMSTEISSKLKVGDKVQMTNRQYIMALNSRGASLGYNLDDFGTMVTVMSVSPELIVKLDYGGLVYKGRDKKIHTIPAGCVKITPNYFQEFRDNILFLKCENQDMESTKTDCNVKTTNQTNTNSNSDCLLKAGMKLTSDINLPNFKQVYGGVIDGKNYQFTMGGTVIVSGNGGKQKLHWYCDSKSPNGIKIG